MFSVNTIPMAFSAAVYEIATFSPLNPINNTQTWTNCIVGKPVRVVARAVTAVAIMAISFVGIFYHLAAGAIETYRARSEYAWEHLKALRTDLLNTLNIFNLFIFALSPNVVLPGLSSVSLIQINYKFVEMPHDNHFHMIIDERKQQIREGKYQLNKWYESVIASRETYVPDDTLIGKLTQPLVDERIQELVAVDHTETRSRVINDTILTGRIYGDFWKSKILTKREEIANNLKLYHIVRTYISRCEWR